MTTMTEGPTQEQLNKHIAGLRDERYRASVKADHLREAAAVLEREADDAERGANWAEGRFADLSALIREKYPHLALPDGL